MLSESKPGLAKTSAFIRVAKCDLQLASVRYRGLLPACAMQEMGWNVRVGSGDDVVPADTALAVAVKPLTQRDLHWVRSIHQMGVPLIVDLCDNVFVDGYGGRGTEVGRRFREIAALAAVVTVPTASLAEVACHAAGVPVGRVMVLPDIVETPQLLAREAALLGVRVTRTRLVDVVRARLVRLRSRAPVLIWFGNHGAGHGSFGLTDLLLFEDALREAARRFGATLWVVSNHRGRFNEIASRLPIECHYFEWTPSLVDELLPRADVCLVPNSLDPFSVTKSPNRALKALHAGVPVVATPTPAYAHLGSCIAFDDPVAGTVGYLADPALRQTHLAEARSAVARHYSLDALTRALRPVIERALGQEGAPS